MAPELTIPATTVSQPKNAWPTLRITVENGIALIGCTDVTVGVRAAVDRIVAADMVYDAHVLRGRPYQNIGFAIAIHIPYPATPWPNWA